MRRKLLAAVATVGITVWGSNQARADMPVVDPANIAQSVTNTANQIAQLKAQLTQLQQTYTMFTTPTNVTGMLPNLNTSYLQNPMPAANSIAGQVVGTGTMNGYGQTFYNSNHTFTPTGNDAVATSLNQNSAALSNIQGIAAKNLGSIESRSAELDNMQDELQNATDIKQVEAINGRLAVESNAIQAQQAQATNLQTLATTQIEAMHLQQQATARQNAEAMQAAFPNELQ